MRLCLPAPASADSSRPSRADGGCFGQAHPWVTGNQTRAHRPSDAWRVWPTGHYVYLPSPIHTVIRGAAD
jgi:hypothetical protein